MPSQPLIESLTTFLMRPDPEWLVDQVLPARDLACLYAPYGQGKSFVGIELAGAITQGRNFGSHKTHKSLVLYLAAEGIDDMKMRFKTLAEAGKVDAENLFISAASPQLLDPTTRKKLRDEVREWLNGRTLGLLVVDTLARHAIGVDENSAASLGALIALYAEIGREFGATVLFIHHAGKDADKGMRGSTALPGAVSTIILCEKEGNNLTLWCNKQRGALEFSPMNFNLRPLNGSAVLDALNAGDQFTDDEMIIIEALEMSQTGVVKASDLVRSDGSIFPHAPKHRAIGALIVRNVIKRVGHGKYSKSQCTK